MAQNYPRRFYKTVTTAEDDGGYVVLLDGRTLKTPGKAKLHITSAHVADLIAMEWDAQEKQIMPEMMPVTRLMNVASELTPNNRPSLVAEARKYGQTDMLCYRADTPATLSQRQAEAWDPILDWARTYKNIPLEITHSVLAIDQNNAALDRISSYAEEFDDLYLTLFVHLTAVFGSVILAMAVMEQYLQGSRAFELSRLDADWQAEHWGEDAETTAKAEALAQEVEALCQILEIKDE